MFSPSCSYSLSNTLHTIIESITTKICIGLYFSISARTCHIMPVHSGVGQGILVHLKWIVHIKCIASETMLWVLHQISIPPNNKVLSFNPGYNIVLKKKKNCIFLIFLMELKFSPKLTTAKMKFEYFRDKKLQRTGHRFDWHH